MNIGLLHPGQMGISVGVALQANDHQVLWLPAGRSADTHARAHQAGFVEADSVAAMAAQCQAVVSVCPPHAAAATAAAVAAAGFKGYYLDANAVAPHTAVSLGKAFGGQFIDGGIIGPPATKPGTTRLYLSGDNAAIAAQWFAEGALQAVAMEAPSGAASALKMCYAGYTKGLSALLLASQALAADAGVEQWLAAEWDLSQPALSKRVRATAAATAPKAWRFAGEMEEIAATYAASELPPGFHQAAADIYTRMASLRQVDQPELSQVLELLLQRRSGH